MYRAADKGTPKVITANRLTDGLVIFVAEGPVWVEAIAEAKVYEDGPELNAAMEFGAEEVKARKVIDPYTIDVAVEGGMPLPTRLRERIRAIGPSVPYGEAERKHLSEAAG